MASSKSATRQFFCNAVLLTVTTTDAVMKHQPQELKSLFVSHVIKFIKHQSFRFLEIPLTLPMRSLSLRISSAMAARALAMTSLTWSGTMTRSVGGGEGALVGDADAKDGFVEGCWVGCDENTEDGCIDGCTDGTRDGISEMAF
jgi:hypothetical protein